MKLKQYAIVKGIGLECPKCKEPMQRRKRVRFPTDGKYFYKEWDVCNKCNHVQHYEEFKCSSWKEQDDVENLFKNL